METAGPGRSFLFFSLKDITQSARQSEPYISQPGTGPSSLLPHLQLADPGAVPVGKARPLDKELPLWVALEGGVGQRVVCLAVRPWRHLCWQRRLAPRPVQDLLDLALEGGALREGETQGGQMLERHDSKCGR